uniref:NADP-dependent oxidoreductase domain-containing protein n=1 Tax=Heterosigma akashiwo TaxID=2829 RepID=A0A7S3UR23_HETAK
MDIACQEFGVNFLDTAEIYPVPPNKDTQGLTEQYIGNWMDKKKNRKDLILASKVAGYGNLYLRKDGEPSRVNKKNIEEALDGSLKRLKTDYLDLYQIHWPDRYVPLFGADGYEPEKEREAVTFMEQLEAMGDLIKKGKIRHWGLSNETPWGVSQFCAAARAAGLPPPASVQNSYSLLVRADYEQSGMLETCAPQNENIALLAYSPLAGGVLTGKYQNVFYPPAGSRLTLFEGFMERYKSSLSRKAVTKYLVKSDEWDLPLADMALAWCYTREFMGATIIGATSAEQLRRNVLALNLPITEDMAEHIEEAYVLFRDPTKIKTRAA